MKVSFIPLDLCSVQNHVLEKAFQSTGLHNQSKKLCREELTRLKDQDGFSQTREKVTAASFWGFISHLTWNKKSVFLPFSASTFYKVFCVCRSDSWTPPTRR